MNIGPGWGVVGPTQNFATISDIQMVLIVQYACRAFGDVLSVNFCFTPRFGEIGLEVSWTVLSYVP